MRLRVASLRASVLTVARYAIQEVNHHSLLVSRLGGGGLLGIAPDDDGVDDRQHPVGGHVDLVSVVADAAISGWLGSQPRAEDQGGKAHRRARRRRDDTDHL